LIEVILVETTPGRYSASLGDEVIVKNHRDPEHAAARVLLARGITGRMTTVGVDGKPRMHFDIEKAAPWTVREDDVGMQLVRWKPFPRGHVEA
jgi:hypothetical protein